jgi:hypothetical protein
MFAAQIAAARCIQYQASHRTIFSGAGNFGSDDFSCTPIAATRTNTPGGADFLNPRELVRGVDVVNQTQGIEFKMR